MQAKHVIWKWMWLYSVHLNLRYLLIQDWVSAHSNTLKFWYLCCLSHLMSQQPLKYTLHNHYFSVISPSLWTYPFSPCHPLSFRFNSLRVPERVAYLRELLDSDPSRLKEVFLESLKLESLRFALVDEIEQNRGRRGSTITGRGKT